MKTKMNMIIIGLIALMGAAFTYVEGQYLTVVANSGLKLRVSPDQDASMLKVIPFGEDIKIINSSDIALSADRINWMDGHWVQVEHKGVRGYVFDGFLTHLPLPDIEFEQIQADLIIALPLESYIKNKLIGAVQVDTIVSGDSFVKYFYKDQNGLTMSTTEEELYFEVDITIPDTRISEIYNLLLCMAESRYERQMITDNSLFIEGADGMIGEIRINGGAATTIKNEVNGNIRIKSLVRFFDGC